MGCHSYNPKVQSKLKKHAKDFMSYETEEKLTWCGGCGNYGIQNALKRALTLEGFTARDVQFCFDIGCNGNGSDKIHGNTIHGLHGRVIPLAAGCALANHKMKVIANAGDGATMSEGINHLVHAVRNDYPMVFMLHNNQNYGLTTGQASATTKPGFPMNASPDGVVAPPMNPSHLVLSLGGTFVARTFSSDPKHMTEIFRKALKHNGFAFIEIMQLCPTYNKATPGHWFWERMKYTCDMKGSGGKEYDPHNRELALKVSEDIYNDLAMGLLYEDRSIPHFLDRLISRKGRKTELTQEVKHVLISNILKRYS